MSFKFYFIQILFVLLTAISCEKSNAPFTDTPIIESYLSPGKYPMVKISRQIPFSEDAVNSSDDINSLVVNFASEDFNNFLTYAGEGIYIDSSVIVTDEKAYSLSFVYNGKNVSANTAIPSKPLNFSQSALSISVMRMGGNTFPQMGSFQMPEPLQLTWDNDDGSYYIVVIENMESNPDPVRDFGDTLRVGNMFRKSPTTSQGIELRPQEFQYFGKHRIILYHVLADYASLYDENISSSQNLTNPSTSITNGYGIFTGLNSDTLYLKVIEAAR
jgi:hypothetical protein